MKAQIKTKLEIRERRIFSETVKKQAVKDLLSKRCTVQQIATAHQTSLTSVYKWLYRYSAQHEQKCTLVVQMESEATKNTALQSRIADLERIVGQKQMEIDFLNKLFEIGSSDLGFDLIRLKRTAPRPRVVPQPPAAARFQNEGTVLALWP